MVSLVQPQSVGRLWLFFHGMIFGISKAIVAKHISFHTKLNTA
jgi:hypothetical protein